MNGSSVAVTCLAGITLYVGLSHFLYYLRSRERRELLGFSASCFSIFLYDLFSAGLYSAESVVEGAEWQKLQFLALSMMGISILWFISDLVKRENRNIDLILIGFYAMQIIAALIGPDNLVVTNTPSIKYINIFGPTRVLYYEMELGPLFVAQGIAGMFAGAYIVFTLIKYSDSPKCPGAKPVLIGATVVFIGVLNDTAVGWGSYNFFYVIEYAYMTMMFAMSYSITSFHVQTELDLRMRKDDLMRLAAAVNSAAEAIIITDTEGIIQYVNPSFKEMTGYPRLEVIGKSTKILNSGKQDEKFYDDLWKTIKSGGTWHGLFTNRKKDGTLYEEEGTIAPVKSSSGDIINFVAVKRDVSLELELEDQLRQSQKMEAIGQLAGKVAHDFTNLLVAIFGHSQMLKNKLPQDSEFQDHLDEILKSANRASSITSELLAFAHKQPMLRKRISLKKVLESAREMIKATVGKEYNLVMDTRNGDMLVDADRSQIEQVLVQLVVNATEALGELGKLTIEASSLYMNRQESAQLESGRREEHRFEGGLAAIQVSDDGPGMDEETQKRIFEPFFSTKGKSDSSGLGLSTVYRTVKHHDGFITVYSVMETGSTFSIYLPIAEGEKTIPPEIEKMVPDNIERTALVLIKDRLIRGVISRILLQLGYGVLEAETLQHAIELTDFRRDEMEIALCDTVSDDSTPEEIADRLGKQIPDARLLFVSSFGQKHLERMGIVPDGHQAICAPFCAGKVRDAILNTR